MGVKGAKPPCDFLEHLFVRTKRCRAPPARSGLQFSNSCQENSIGNPKPKKDPHLNEVHQLNSKILNLRRPPFGRRPMIKTGYVYKEIIVLTLLPFGYKIKPKLSLFLSLASTALPGLVENHHPDYGAQGETPYNPSIPRHRPRPAGMLYDELCPAQPAAPRRLGVLPQNPKRQKNQLVNEKNSVKPEVKLCREIVIEMQNMR